MKTKLLTTALCSSVLLLTACGGGGSDDKQSTTQAPTISNINYNNASTVDLVIDPVLNLSVSENNIIADVANFAEEIHWVVTDPENQGYITTCDSGTIQKNSNGSVTFNNCKNFKYNGIALNLEETLTLSGTVQSQFSETSIFDQYNITLGNFIIEYSTGGIDTLNGNVVLKYTPNVNNSLYQTIIKKMEISWVDGSEKEFYTLSDYSLDETFNHVAPNNSVAKGKGKLQADFNGQKYSIEFNSNIDYTQTATTPTVNTANINIVDTTNIRNNISIRNSTNGNALISAFANSTSVAGFPKTVNWAILFAE